MIVKSGNKYTLKSKDGSKTLGKNMSKEQAKKRERQVQFFKALAARKGK